MKIKKFRKSIVDNFTFEEKTATFVVNYKTVMYNYIIDIDKVWVPKFIKAMKEFRDGTHDLTLITLGNEFVSLESSKRIIKRGSAIDKYVPKEFEPITFINYHNYGLFTQLDGITTIVGMSGAGKTHSALTMLKTYSMYFDKIAYLNYELPERDIIERLNEMFVDEETLTNIVDKLYIKEGIMTSLDLEEILSGLDAQLRDKIVFIIDNVGSVRGQENNVYQKQNEFIKHLDNFAKDRECHVLALTQTIKDHNFDYFNESGEIKDSITMSIMSGSIDLGNLSRSVLFTAYNGETGEFKTKVLKRGTGKFYHEVNSKEVSKRYVTNPAKRRL